MSGYRIQFWFLWKGDRVTGRVLLYGQHFGLCQANWHCQLEQRQYFSYVNPPHDEVVQLEI